ncbi:MAG: IPTL-CTERM sorting domain-containing protein [Candidatus Zixiibacteriota bacterium]|nr:MAG: IPTL-CTERM sorting domain-containing protein [candidate division Zixibacteria bacterium]
MKRIPSILVVVLVSVFVVKNISADWTIDDGYKMHYPQMPYEPGWIVKSSLPVILAEDWQCSDSGWIKDLHFWGGWKNGLEGNITRFLVVIYADIPANPPDILFSKPGAELWSKMITNFVVSDPIIEPSIYYWYDPSTGMTSFDDSLTYYQYNIFLDEQDWFRQERGTIYWLSVSALVLDPETYEWGWFSTSDNWNDDAVWTYPDTIWYHMHEPPGCPAFIPGDVDGNCVVDSNDVNHLVAYFQMTGPPPRLAVIDTAGTFYPAADANGSCSINSYDATYLIMYLDHGGPSPLYCDMYPPAGTGTSLDLAFVVNSGPPEPIPTLNEWGMLIMGLLLLAAGTAAVVRRRKTAAVTKHLKNLPDHGER